MANRVIRAGEIERALSAVYNRYLEKIRQDQNYPWDIVSLRRKYGDPIYSATRTAVTGVYNEGINYVGYKTNVDVYPTQANIDEIKSETDRAINSFWGRITDDARRARLQDVSDEDKPDLDTESFMRQTATSMASAGLALATVAKTAEVIDQVVGQPQLKWHTQADEKVCPICAPLDGTVYDYNDPSIPTPGQNGPGGTHSNCRCYLDMV